MGDLAAPWNVSSGLFSYSSPSSGPKGVIYGYVAFLAELWMLYPERLCTLITFFFLIIEIVKDYIKEGHIPTPGPINTPNLPIPHMSAEITSPELS